MRRYQVLAHQPLAVPIDQTIPQPFRVYPDMEYPCVAFRPVHETIHDQMQEGGTIIRVEFELDDVDLLHALNQGLELIDDVLSAISISSSIPFLPSIPQQVLDCTPGEEHHRFLLFLLAQPLRWQSTITPQDIRFLQTVTLHWRELETGSRIRRAARRYKQALGEPDPISAFQSAYMGLEALEKPLAKEIGIEPGVERIEGTCSVCGGKYERKRTVLAGVRAMIRGEMHGGSSEQGNREWKEISGLRTQLVHGLADPGQVIGDAERLLPAIMHHLHNASAHLAHVHDLESSEYRLSRSSGMQYIMEGRFPGSIPEQVRPLLEAGIARWVDHEGHGLVPEFAITNNFSPEVECRAVMLAKNLFNASESDLVPAMIAPQLGRESAQ